MVGHPKLTINSRRPNLVRPVSLAPLCFTFTTFTTGWENRWDGLEAEFANIKNDTFNRYVRWERIQVYNRPIELDHWFSRKIVNSPRFTLYYYYYLYSHYIIFKPPQINCCFSEIFSAMQVNLFMVNRMGPLPHRSLSLFKRCSLFGERAGLPSRLTAKISRFHHFKVILFLNKGFQTNFWPELSFVWVRVKAFEKHIFSFRTHNQEESRRQCNWASSNLSYQTYSREASDNMSHVPKPSKLSFLKDGAAVLGF